jgi:lipopolysaccharide export LptBFGC system permease protein LptF
MKKYKFLIYLFIFIAALFGAWYMGLKTSLFKKYEQESATVMLDKIEKVVKLVAVEGNISEIYDYKDYYSFDIAPFRKKALVRVNAKVSAGYNFENMVIDVDETNKIIIIRNFPEAEILSIDHDLDYYDITQGTFNKFTTEDYNKINSRAKEYVAEKAKDNKIIDAAQEQKKDLLDMISLLVKAGGWEIRIEDSGFLN